MKTDESIYTLGNSKCAIELFRMIKDDPKSLGKVSKFLRHNNRVLKSIDKIEDTKVKIPLLNSWRSTELSILKDNYNYLEKHIKTRVRNLVIARYRESIKKVGS